jgi:tRNA(Ile)-lysidine synthase
MSVHRAVAACRHGVRRALEPVPRGGCVVVACSGGADSLALMAATVFEARRRKQRVVGATVDHGLQEGSAERAATVVAQLAGLGADETVSVRVRVEGGGRGPEAAAREARYSVLEEVAGRFGADLVLLGHTLDDQAETVLLGLTRGSGGRSIAGMRPAYAGVARPLLEVTRAETEAACTAQGIEWWDDPHNRDPAYTRSRIRATVMPLLETELGPGVARALARTAQQLRPDMEALDRLAATAYDRLSEPGGMSLAGLRGLDDAIASRVLRRAAVAAGAIDSELFHVHVRALVDLVAGTVSGEIQLPGPVSATREGDRLAFSRPVGRG